MSRTFFFDKLGQLVTEGWGKKHFREKDFPMVALTALRKLPPIKHTSFVEITRWGVTADSLPFQSDLASHFGQPPLSVYQGRDFRIEVLYWVTGLPAIHQHSFSGAFHVLHGSSLHTLWSFKPLESFGIRLGMGEVALTDVELLQTGDSRLILAGQALVHSTFHLERPSLTVVIRTNTENDSLPQYAYLPPLLRYDPFAEVALIKRRIQLMRLLLLCGRYDEFFQLARKFCATGDSYGVFQLFISTTDLIVTDAHSKELFDAAGKRHTSLVAALRPALARKAIVNKIAEIRKRLKDADAQFFLALLLNLTDRESIFQMLRKQFPNEKPAQSSYRIIATLVRQSLIGIPKSDKWLKTLEYLLRNKMSPLRNEQLYEIDQLSDSASNGLAASEIVIALRKHWLLAPFA